eukprot:TRINITY_DN7894_c0_g2_i1.p1 TRINITY_DN7894_c0_g2~~TRINITY_DN7894_c0_g2_i1.p1  ORF type:complete len:609 (-),score=94.88 TRINITY_DN7894_c0_g2_i1:698-2524(-)
MDRRWEDDDDEDYFDDFEHYEDEDRGLKGARGVRNNLDLPPAQRRSPSTQSKLEPLPPAGTGLLGRCSTQNMGDDADDEDETRRRRKKREKSRSKKRTGSKSKRDLEPVPPLPLQPAHVLPPSIGRGDATTGNNSDRSRRRGDRRSLGEDGDIPIKNWRGGEPLQWPASEPPRSTAPTFGRDPKPKNKTPPHTLQSIDFSGRQTSARDQPAQGPMTLPMGGGVGPARGGANALRSSGDELQMVDDLDEDFGESTSAPVPRQQPQFAENTLTVGLTRARKLREFLLGRLQKWPPSWEFQGFSFNQAIPYGLVQHEGGPCGVIAAVQAHVIRHLMHTPGSAHTTPESALSLALADIIWRSSRRSPEGIAYVCLPPAGAGLGVTGQSLAPHALENYRLFSFRAHGELAGFLQQKLGAFQSPRGIGVILLVVSCVLSRGGVESTRQDMDLQDTPLVVEHGYCSQELVNLLVAGVAASNVFNGTRTLDGGNGDVSEMKGIPSRCDVGFLSYFEHFDYCAVGSFMKEPASPCWLICAESHYSVLYSKEPLLPQPRFDLYYYDELAKQEEEVRLTIDPTAAVRTEPEVPPSPLEDTIRTKWRAAAVDWNGHERLL